VKSRTTSRYRALFSAASTEQRARILAAYELFKVNPQHPSLRFKKVHQTKPIYSARVDLDWRAVGIMTGDTVLWFFVGSHDDYVKLLKAL
jgi:hypothetical protein